MISPVFVLGVSRSGTTLLRIILDRSPGIAIPDESFFIPLLARRHRGKVDRGRFLDDVSRLSTPAAWGLSPADVAMRLRPGMRTGAAIAAIFEAHAANEGKPRWGDKTPMYMRHLPLLERLFPDAQYVHLIRDGRDAALSFLRMPEGSFTRTWAHPDTAAEFACLWRTEVAAARALGQRVGSARYLEVRYEDLVARPDRAVRGICEFASLPCEPAMLDYVDSVDVARKPHQQRLLESPRSGVRDWRTEMTKEDVSAFESIAGDLLAELDYELSERPARSGWGAKLALARYRATLSAWNAAVSATQRSPLWRCRHPAVTTTAERPARG
ncbi:MAG: sulfotransferase [Actinomycetota bacterium]|nr:sulfotransferase [Actinomycetota bacterium]